MKYMTLSTLFVIFIIFSTGCTFNMITEKGSGKLVKEEKNVADFNAVNMQCAGNVYVKQGEQESMMIETDDNIISMLRYDIKKGKLIIYSEANINPTKLNVYVTMINVKGLKMSGSGTIKAETPLRAEDMHIRMDGSGTITIDELSAAKTISEINGSGNINLKGKTSENKIEINGSGNFNAKDFEAENTKIEINGSGDCYVTAKSALNVEIAGSGNVNYKGEPNKIHQEIVGSGKIQKINK